ncbi:MAG: hypothetical protein OEZ65_14300 [Gemmatimonadota bacterium]|nr:hypothetical protein [Gemmatimonadota bacterium]
MRVSRNGITTATAHMTTLVLIACAQPDSTATAQSPNGDPSTTRVEATASFPISGQAIHYFSTAVVHGQDTTETGMVQRSTDVIQITGDLTGTVLYHPVSVFDFAAGTLVNTGIQVFSGTVKGSAPVLLYDDSFRFEVNLNTGETVGEIHLGRNPYAPPTGGWYECEAFVVSTGMTPEGNAMVDYRGTCTAYGNVG